MNARLLVMFSPCRFAKLLLHKLQGDQMFFFAQRSCSRKKCRTSCRNEGANLISEGANELFRANELFANEGASEAETFSNFLSVASFPGGLSTRRELNVELSKFWIFIFDFF